MGFLDWLRKKGKKKEEQTAEQEPLLSEQQEEQAAALPQEEPAKSSPQAEAEQESVADPAPVIQPPPAPPAPQPVTVEPLAAEPPAEEPPAAEPPATVEPAEQASELPSVAAEPTKDASSKEQEQEQEPPQKEKKTGLFARLASGLKKTTDNISSIFEGIFSGSEIDEDFYEELEEALIIADVGMDTTSLILSQLRAKVKEDRLTQPAEAKLAVREIVAKLMQAEQPFVENETSILLIVGVNGVGKTTSIGKLAAYYKEQGKQVMMAAGDTFRAAATEQLVEWSKRADVPIVKQQEGADPAAVVYDAIQSAKAKDMDMLIVDTAGRLHNKKNLMDELEKIRRVISREFGTARIETLLVLDATTGQNGLAQARIFAQSVHVTGIILSKLDGTAKGGVAVAVKQEIDIPVRFVGVGERIDDLQPFDPVAYAEALFA